uniref:Uncharacterized protein n=1 Tax=Brassica campestris TaxID=3711 RepID=M4DYN3_BRACM
MNYISDGSPLTMVVVGVKRHSSGLDRVSSASLGYDHGHDESWCEPWWLVNGDYVSSSPIDSHAHVKKKGTRERYRLMEEAADLSLDTPNLLSL